MKILNTYASNNRVTKYLRQKLKESKGEIENSIIMVEDFGNG